MSKPASSARVSLGRGPSTFLRYWRWNDWYFRIRDRGLSIQPLEGHTAFFSEREGYTKAWHVFGVCIRPLWIQRWP